MIRRTNDNLFDDGDQTTDADRASADDGHYLDAQRGLQYYAARHHNSEAGRWLFINPVGYEAGEMNLDCYVAGALCNVSDPTALTPAGNEKLTVA